MRKEIEFTKDGFDVFAKVVLSCYPVHYELSPVAMSYLKGVILGEIELDRETLLEKMPVLNDSILDFAIKKGYQKVSSDVVVEFFSGSVHYEKILVDFEENKLHILPGSVYSLRTMFAHLAVPIELMGLEDDGYVGRYRKGQFDFLVRGLVATNKDKKFFCNIGPSAPKTVLVHFGTIIDPRPHAETLVEIRELQGNAEVFLLSCKFLQLHGGVDYNSFPADCRMKTEKILKNISL